MGKVKSISEAIESSDLSATSMDAQIRASGATNQAQWNTFIDGRTDAQIVAMVKRLFKDWFKLIP